MNEIEWYYAHDEQQFGPVSTVDLKRLAERGDLVPSDLVWRQGMSDWVQASEVKGLFQPQPTAAQPPAAPTPEPKTAAQPARVEPAEQKPSKPLRHLVEVLLDFAQRSDSPAFVEASCRLFTLAGHYAIYLAMVLLLAGGVAVSLHTKTLDSALFALAAIPVLAVLQYAAGQFCAALDRVNRSTRAMVASPALINLIGVAGMLVGLLLLLVLATQAFTSQMYSLLPTALLAFIICQHLAAVSLIHVDENITVSDDLSPGEEALGTIVALLKISARVVPVAFGAGVCCATVMLLVACAFAVQGGETSVITGKVTALGATITLAAFAALPLLAYLAFLLATLIVDILDGLLTLRHPHNE
jgi:hypothetical protein